MLKKVYGQRLGDAAGERRPPNAARTKHVPPNAQSGAFWETLLGNATGDALSSSAILPTSIILGLLLLIFSCGKPQRCRAG
jgi:hypothetical protein